MAISDMEFLLMNAGILFNENLELVSPLLAIVLR